MCKFGSFIYTQVSYSPQSLEPSIQQLLHWLHLYTEDKSFFHIGSFPLSWQNKRVFLVNTKNALKSFSKMHNIKFSVIANLIISLNYLQLEEFLSFVVCLITTALRTSLSSHHLRIREIRFLPFSDRWYMAMAPHVHRYCNCTILE